MITGDFPCHWINKTISHKINERLREQHFLCSDAFGISRNLKVHFVNTMELDSCLDVGKKKGRINLRN